jgi:cobalamin synthase
MLKMLGSVGWIAVICMLCTTALANMKQDLSFAYFVVFINSVIALNTAYSILYYSYKEYIRESEIAKTKSISEKSIEEIDRENMEMLVKLSKPI